MFIFQMSFFNTSLSHFLLVSRLQRRDKLTQTESSLYLHHVRKSNNGSFCSYRVSSIIIIIIIITITITIIIIIIIIIIMVMIIKYLYSSSVFRVIIALAFDSND